MIIIPIMFVFVIIGHPFLYYEIKVLFELHQNLLNLLALTIKQPIFRLKIFSIYMQGNRQKWRR